MEITILVEGLKLRRLTDAQTNALSEAIRGSEENDGPTGVEIGRTVAFIPNGRIDGVLAGLDNFRAFLADGWEPDVSHAGDHWRDVLVAQAVARVDAMAEMIARTGRRGAASAQAEAKALDVLRAADYDRYYGSGWWLVEGEPAYALAGGLLEGIDALTLVLAPNRIVQYVGGEWAPLPERLRAEGKMPARSMP